MNARQYFAQVVVLFPLLFTAMQSVAESLVDIPGTDVRINLPGNWQVLNVPDASQRVIVFAHPNDKTRLLALFRISTIESGLKDDFDPNLDRCWKMALSALRGTEMEKNILKDGFSSGCVSARPMNQYRRNLIERDAPELVALVTAKTLRLGPDVVAVSISEKISSGKRVAIEGFLDASVNLQTEYPSAPEKKAMPTLHDWAVLLGKSIAQTHDAKSSVADLPQLSFAQTP